jgi:hypothetical protein
MHTAKTKNLSIVNNKTTGVYSDICAWIASACALSLDNNESKANFESRYHFFKISQIHIYRNE